MIPRPVPLADAARLRELWLRPASLLEGPVAATALAQGTGLALADGRTVFTACEVLARHDEKIVTALASIAELQRLASPRIEGQIATLTAPRAPWAGLALDRPLVMGIVNVTPDSFSDGGAFLSPERAIAHGRALVAAGADIVDIGGELTRPGATPVFPEEEIRRILPVVDALARDGAVVSVDTRHAPVMAAALAAGARIVNDVSALAGAGALDAVARSDAAVVLMHMQGEPRTMQRAPSYALASLDIVDYLARRIAVCEAAGVARARIVVDPGIGFGKTPEHNLEILARVSLFHATGTGVMIGVSRKSLVGRIAGADAGERLPGSLAGAIHAVRQGVQIVRVHDVAETRQALLFDRAVSGAG